MSSSQHLDTHWSCVLEQAAKQCNGGVRSFPLSREATFLHNYAYNSPNEDYQKLFFRQATVSSSQQESLFCSHSAGWLIPNDASNCKPVFIAHSTLLAIWLLKETLPNNTLSADGWKSLVMAAQLLTQHHHEDDQEDRYKEPPSA